MVSSIRDFLKLEAAGGLLLFAAAVLAMIVANSPLASWYDGLFKMPVEVRVGPLEIAKPFLLWINDGLMAIFFFLVGLELKREIVEGELSNLKTVALPGFGAVGGMVLPAAIYSWANWGDSVAMQGWAIPAATDIAFALGILALLGKRVPTALKIFLVSLAIFDDIGAIIIIALFYTADLSLKALVVALLAALTALVMNRRGVSIITPYVAAGLVMWVALLKSGVHATLAGVLLAVFIPMRDARNPETSPLRSLEHDLHATVAFVILPLFAFANAGLRLVDVGPDYLLHPVPLGIAAGLFFGKQLGVFAACWLGVRLGIAALPGGVGWSALYGAGVLCGVGFTMSLFIGSLAFESTKVDLLFDDRLGIIVGSVVSGVFGYLILRNALPKGTSVPRD